MGDDASKQQEFKTLLMDMDGVLAEVSKSYRAAIIKTCHSYGAKSVTQDTVTEWKIRGNANDDWKLSHALILNDPDGKRNVSLQEVTDTFEMYYQGTEETEGLRRLETLIPSRDTLVELRKRSKPGVGIVTGRPRKDCMNFLKDHDLEDLIDVTYCMEDGPGKPDPFPIRKACELLGVEPGPSVAFIGDTPDDIKAAVDAGCTPVAVVTPEGIAASFAEGKPYDALPICVAMKEAGADIVLEPGFSALIGRFASP